MDEPKVRTALVDLREASLGDMGRNFDQLQADAEVLLGQVDRPRHNIGSTGPPGRAD